MRASVDVAGGAIPDRIGGETREGRIPCGLGLLGFRGFWGFWGFGVLGFLGFRGLGVLGFWRLGVLGLGVRVLGLGCLRV